MRKRVPRRVERSIALSCLIALPAAATIYESPINVRDEDDLRAMGERGDLSDATVQTLLELMQDGVDLNTAGRDELYELPGLTYAEVDAVIAFRATQGRVDEPSALVAAGALTPEQLREIAPFILRAERGRAGSPVSGHYRAMGLYTLTDAVPPPVFAQALLRGPSGFSGGIGVTTARNRPGSPFYDATRDAPSVTPPQYALDVPKFFLQWRGANVHVLAGTFRVGFGERLTLDTTARYRPSGVYADDIYYVPRSLVGACHVSAGELGDTPCDPAQRSHYETNDFKWRDSFRGVAVSVENLSLAATGWHASLDGFASYQTRSIYQYELFSRSFCDDPRTRTRECQAPSVYEHIGDGSGAEPTLEYSTLPDVFDELAAGGHIEVANAMFTFGVTGYGAMPRFRVPQLQLDFQSWSKYPFNGPFGAIGTHARATLAGWSLFLEVARSFDHEPLGGGGLGAVLRAVYGRRGRELELVARYYDILFVNPYARPVSSPDDVDGSRARDEAGLRVKYGDRSLGRFQLRSFIDFWVLPYDAKLIDAQLTGSDTGDKAGTANLWAQLRGDYRGWKLFEPSLWLDYRNKDLAHSGNGACYASADGRSFPPGMLCTGERYRIAARLDVRPFGETLAFTATYLHDFVSDVRYVDRLDQDARFLFEVRSRPLQWLLLRARLRYTKLDLFTNDALEQSLWSFLEATWLGLRPVQVTARYDNYLWLDRRPSTLNRTPNPEHRFRLELEGHF
jgi:hypothetical protein